MNKTPKECSSPPTTLASFLKGAPAGVPHQLGLGAVRDRVQVPHYGTESPSRPGPRAPWSPRSPLESRGSGRPLRAQLAESSAERPVREVPGPPPGDPAAPADLLGEEGSLGCSEGRCDCSGSFCSEKPSPPVSQPLGPSEQEFHLHPDRLARSPPGRSPTVTPAGAQSWTTGEPTAS